MESEQHGAAFGFWPAIAGWWIDEASGGTEYADPGGVTWLHGVEDARNRWQDVLRRRLS